MTPNLVTPTELARIISEKTGEPFSRQAVHKAIGDGLIPFESDGRKKLVDLNNKAVKLYITTGNRQREQAKKKDIMPVTPSKKPSRKISKSKNSSEKQSQKQPKQSNRSEIGQSSDSELTQFEIKQRTNIATMRAKELDVEIKMKNYLPTDMITASLIYHIERLHSVLERSAAVFVQEIGSSILEAGEVQPKHINQFTDMILESIHNTKKAIDKEIKKYEPK